MTVRTYRSRQRVQAIQWTGDNTDEVLAFLDGVVQPPRTEPRQYIHLGDGRMAARGEWVIDLGRLAEPDARFQAMRPVLFEVAFELMPDEH